MIQQGENNETSGHQGIDNNVEILPIQTIDDAPAGVPRAPAFTTSAARHEGRIIDLIVGKDEEVAEAVIQWILARVRYDTLAGVVTDYPKRVSVDVTGTDLIPHEFKVNGVVAEEACDSGIDFKAIITMASRVKPLRSAATIVEYEIKIDRPSAYWEIAAGNEHRDDDDLLRDIGSILDITTETYSYDENFNDRPAVDHQTLVCTEGQIKVDFELFDDPRLDDEQRIYPWAARSVDVRHDGMTATVRLTLDRIETARQTIAKGGQCLGVYDVEITEVTQ